MFETALTAAQEYAAAALSAVRAMVSVDGKICAQRIDHHQRAVHGYAWIASSVQALAALAKWAEALEERGAFGRGERLVCEIAFGETIAQLLGGISMGQNEIVRPTDLGIAEAAQILATTKGLENGNTAINRAELIAYIRDGGSIDDSLSDATLDSIRNQYRRFTDQQIIPHAHGWHLQNALIPDHTIAQMAALGTFGICIPEQYGGLGLGKLVMCVATEELSRGWIGAGSLGTRSEIAGELIMLGGTDAQRSQWLPCIASGEILPTAVFTEPDTGSDMASLSARAVRSADGWEISGAKTWITHAARSDIMTMLVRTLPNVPGHAGLSMLLVPKTRGSESQPFSDDGMSGSEIEVLGYRGMREYSLQFDAMKAPADALLGGEEGQGFKQLMATFEGARIQTAARAVGVARRAFDLGFDYAQSRKQFSKALIEFPRVSDKLAMMLVDMITARELTYYSAREKDKGKRCDIEAGMAKLIAARAAWSSADAALQIHGGNGYALEYEISRILCDARILNIFEGAAEIQAQVIARGKLQDRE